MAALHQDRLSGWKAISGYLGRSVRTAQRWEAHFELPVRRLHGPSGATVLAYREEIDAWRQSPQGRAAAAEKPAASSAADPDDTPTPPLPAQCDVALSSPVARPGRRWAWPAWTVGAGTIVAGGLLALGRPGVAGSSPNLVCPGDCQVRQGQTIVLRADGAARTDTFLRWIRSATGQVESFRPALVPDDHGTITWGFTTDCTSRPGSYGVRLVHEGSGASTNMLQVRIMPESSCDSPVADLVAEGVTLVATRARSLDWIGCRFTLRNQGSVPAPSSVARLRLGRSPDRSAVTDRVLGDVVAPAIAVGGAVTLEHTFQVPPDVQRGVAYYVWVVADNGSAVLERVGTNNFARSSALTFEAPH